ncbi:MAG: glycosyltransferase, partial [Micrococcales bacterium]|nr:glycosyltransferase [Micrococcales bacterium]
MRIAVLGPNWNPLAQPYAGGQEALVATLVRLLRARGHDILLYGHADTDPQLATELVPFAQLPRLSTIAALDPQLPEPRFLADQHAYVGAMADLVGRSGIDAVLNHCLHQLPLVLSRLVRVPLVTTLHTPPFPWLELGAALAGPNCRYIAVSEALACQWTTLRPAPTVIRNGIALDRFCLGAGGPDLVWVGRITAEKGTHLAIEAARLAGRRLRIVGPIADPTYFDARVRPMLGSDVEYLGHLDQREVARVVGGSAAALVTPQWDEPFGLVAAEAAACGTPVVALRRGGLGEVIAPGMGVFAADGDPAASLAAAVPFAMALDRGEVRGVAARWHSAERMVTEYERLLQGLVAGTPTAP